MTQNRWSMQCSAGAGDDPWSRRPVDDPLAADWTDDACAGAAEVCQTIRTHGSIAVEDGLFHVD